MTLKENDRSHVYLITFEYNTLTNFLGLTNTTYSCESVMAQSHMDQL